jgi:hypothetical protein
MEEDVELTQEEQAQLEVEETGEQQPLPETPGEHPVDLQAPVPGEKPKPAKKHEETVAYDRFEQLNERLKQTEQRLVESDTYRERWARLEERQRQAQEAAQRMAEAEAQAKLAKLRPDAELDPQGARIWDNEQRALRAEQRVVQLEQQFQQLNAQGQVRDANFEMQNWLAFQVPQARSRFQDYDTRVDYARAARAAWWSSSFQLPDGRQVQLFSPEMARDITAREELVLLQRAKELGIPVADAVVRLSDTWGYPQWLAQQQQAVAPQNGQAHPGARQAAPGQLLPSGAERLQQIQRGQAVQGMGRVASGETNAPTAWQTMSPLEFKTFVGNMPDDQYVRMVQDQRFGKQFERRVSEIDLTDLNAA